MPRGATLERQDAPSGKGSLRAFPFVEAADLGFEMLAPHAAGPSLPPRIVSAGDDEANPVAVDRDNWQLVNVVDSVWHGHVPSIAEGSTSDPFVIVKKPGTW